ncbi:hypothetical protein Tco_0494853 [Tanacetum coccineum]
MQVESDTPKTPPTAKGKRLKTFAKTDKPAKKKQPAKTSKAKGLTALFEVALTEVEQLKLATKRSLIQTHISHASGSGADEGTGAIPGVLDVPTYNSDDEQISWKSSDEEDDDEVSLNDDDDDDDDVDNQDDDNQDDDNQDDDNQDDNNEQTDSDNNGDDFVHLMFSTHDEEEREEESFDPRVQTPSHAESTDDESNEESDEEVQGANTEDEEINEEATHEEDEANELYREVNVNLEGRDTVMTDAPLPTIQATQETEDTHVIITAPITPEGQQQSSSVSSGFITNMLNPRTDTCIDSIFTLNTEATSLVDVSVTTIVEPPLVSATTLPPPPTPLIIHIQQTPVPTLTTVPSSYLQDLPNFALYSGLTIDLKLWKLTSLSSSKQTNLLKQSLLFLSIIDAYLANKMHEAVKTVVQLQSERLRDEAQAENADFLNKLNDNIKKIINDQVKEQIKAQVYKILPKIKKTVNEQLEAEVMTRSSTESKTSLAIAARGVHGAVRLG